MKLEKILSELDSEIRKYKTYWTNTKNTAHSLRELIWRKNFLENATWIKKNDRIKKYKEVGIEYIHFYIKK